MLAGAALVQDEDQPPRSAAEVQRLMLEAAQPGAEHELIARYCGDFDEEITFWMQPGAQPLKLKGSSEHEMVLGGRFRLSRAASEFMGSRTESMSMLGFDRRHEEFTLVSFDTAGTYWVSAQGPYDAETRTARMHGTDDDPIGGVVQDYDFVMTLVDDDTLRFEIWFNDEAHAKDGKPFKMVEVTSRRKKQ
jgi:hypothetical protein